MADSQSQATGIPAAISAIGATLRTQMSQFATGVGVSGVWGIGITGNAGTATRLTNSRTFNGSAFDGTQNVTIGHLQVGNRKTVETVADADATTWLQVTAGKDDIPVRLTATGNSGIHLESGLGKMTVKSNQDLELFSDTSVKLGAQARPLTLNTSGFSSGRTLNLPDGDVTLVTGTMLTAVGDMTFYGRKTFDTPIIARGFFDVNGSGANSQVEGLYIGSLGGTVGTTKNPTNTAVLTAKYDDEHNVAFSVDSQGYLWGFYGDATMTVHAFQSKVRQADKLSSERTLSFSGEVTGSIKYDGSADTAGTLTLAASGVTPGTYQTNGMLLTPLTFDSKGRLTKTGTAVPIAVNWQNVMNRPTTALGFGITDTVNNQGNVTHPGMWRFSNARQAVSSTDAAVVVDGGLSVAKNVRIGGDTVFVGKATFMGAVIQVSGQQTLVADNPTIVAGGSIAPTADDGYDRGLEFRWHDGTGPLQGFLGYSRVSNQFRFIPRATAVNGRYSGAAGVLEANLVGDVSGNASTASKLLAPRTLSITGDAVGSQTFDGSQDANISLALNDVVTAGTYNNVTGYTRPFTVDSKGRVVQVGAPMINTVDWTNVQNKPTTPSDHRLKTITSNFIDSAAFFQRLQIYQGTWNNSGKRFIGPLAHELQALIPEAVTGVKDAVDLVGRPVFQTVNYAAPELISIHLAETQALRARVAILEEETRELTDALLDAVRKHTTLSEQVALLDRMIRSVVHVKG